MSLSRLEKLIQRRDPNGGIDVQVYNKLKELGSFKVGDYIGMRLMKDQLISSLNRLKKLMPIDFDGTTATLPSSNEGFGMGDMSKDPKRAFKGARWTVKYNETNTMKKSELKEVIKELLSEMWADTSITPTGAEDGGDKEDRRPTGRITEPGADAALVDLYKGGGGGKSDTLPSVGGAMSEEHPLSKYIDGDGTEEDLSKQTERPKGVNVYEKLQSLIKEVVSNAIKEHDESEEEKSEVILFKQIQSAAHWLSKRMEHNELVGRDVIQAIDLIKLRSDELVNSHEKMMRKKQQEPLKRRLQYKHGKPVTGMNEKAPVGWEKTVKAMKKHPEISNPFALANYMKNKGDKPHKK